MAKEKRPSWVIRALKAAFASNPTKDTKVSRVKRKHPDYLYSATKGEVDRRNAMKKRGNGSGRA